MPSSAELGPEGIAAGELAERQPVGIPAHIFGTHDFVGLAVLEHAVLMDAGLVGKGIGADDGLVRLHRIAGDAGHQLGRRHDLRGVDARVATEHILARAHRHHDFFQRGIAGTLAETIDGAFDLARAVHHGGKRVGDGHAEIVVAVRRPDHLVGIRHALDQLLHALAPQGGNAVADGVGHVERFGAGLDHLVEDADQKIHVGAHRILGREFDVVGIFERELDRLDRRLDHLVGLHAQLLFHVDRAGGDEGVDAARTSPA